MNILHIANIDNNPFEGVSVVVPQYVFFQASQGHKVGFININGIKISGLEQQLYINEKITLDKILSIFTKPEIVVFHECYRKEYLNISRELRKKNIPYVIVPHGSLGVEAQKKKALKKKIANILLFNTFINGAAGLQLLSEKEFKSTHFGKYKFIATNGVSLPEKQKKTFSKDRIKYCYIGRLDAYHKGLDLLIESISLIKNELKQYNASFSIYGPDYQGRYANIKKLIEKFDVQDIVSLNHEVAGEEKVEILTESDIFIQTSRFEGMPLGILEALSYGLPCLVTMGTNIGKEIESFNAGWASETNVRSLSSTILKSVKDVNQYADYGANGIALVKKRYTWDSITLKTVDKYKELISR